MIRRDYIIRLVEEAARMLMGIREHIGAHRDVEAGQMLDQAFLDLVGQGPEQIVRMSETELLALLAREDSAPVVQEKSMILAALLDEAAQLRASQGRAAESKACRIRALDLLLSLHFRNPELAAPAFVPRIALLHDELAGAELPLPTLAALWRHYELTGAFAQAENALFALLEAQPQNPALHSEARVFYQRLLRQSDDALVVGNLPREEVEAGLAKLRERGA